MKEKELTRARDALTAQHRGMRWTAVGKAYAFARRPIDRRRCWFVEIFGEIL